MSDEQDKYAIFSKAAYDVYYHDVDFALKELRDYGYKEWAIDPKLSDKNSVVLTDRDSVVISYRGSDFSNVGDIYTDANILIGRHRMPIPSQRFYEAEEKYLAAKTNYAGDITLTGHSLGNTLALYVGRKHSVRSVGFNTGSSVADIAVGSACKLFGRCNEYKTHTLYTTGDIVSFGSTFGKEQIVRVPVKEKKDFLNHSLTNFLPEKQQGELPLYLTPAPRLARSRTPKYILNTELCHQQPSLPQCRIKPAAAVMI